MIIKATEKDRNRLFNYIGMDNPWSLFIYGDIYEYGFDKPIAKTYFKDDNGKIGFVILFYRNTLVQFFCQDNSFNPEEVISFLKQHKVSMISGKEEQIQRLSPSYPEKKEQPTYLCSLFSSSPLIKAPLKEGYKARKLRTKTEFRQMADIIFATEEFTETAKNPQELAETEFESHKHGSIYMGIFNKDNKLVSIASSTASNDVSAMICGVSTLKSERRQGLAKACVSCLAKEEFSKGKKMLCLFYDNPEAGKIYNQIGFKEIGRYVMLH